MKPLTRSLALGLALIATAPIWALPPKARLDAPTAEGKVTQLTTQLLEEAQFAHQPLDGKMAAKFLDRYLDALDGTHELFFQSDVAEFHRSVPQLAQTMRAGDPKPAHVIFDRYLQRIAERAAFVAKTLAGEKFEFTGSERYSFDRENAARPRDAAEARELWRSAAAG